MVQNSIFRLHVQQNEVIRYKWTELEFLLGHKEWKVNLVLLEGLAFPPPAPLSKRSVPLTHKKVGMKVKRSFVTCNMYYWSGFALLSSTYLCSITGCNNMQYQSHYGYLPWTIGKQILVSKWKLAEFPVLVRRYIQLTCIAVFYILLIRLLLLFPEKLY